MSLSEIQEIKKIGFPLRTIAGMTELISRNAISIEEMYFGDYYG
jgi:hypothetical protein